MRVRTLDFSEAAAHAMACLRDSYVSTQLMNPEFPKRRPDAVPGKELVIVPVCELASLGPP